MYPFVRNLCYLVIGLCAAAAALAWAVLYYFVGVSFERVPDRRPTSTDER